MAISNGDRCEAAQMAAALGSDIVVLSDPSMGVISRYGMGAEGASMATMGYVVIDRSGRISVRRIDPLFGAHAHEIVNAVRDAAGGSRGEMPMHMGGGMVTVAKIA